MRRILTLLAIAAALTSCTKDVTKGNSDSALLQSIPGYTASATQVLVQVSSEDNNGELHYATITSAVIK